MLLGGPSRYRGRAMTIPRRAALALLAATALTACADPTPTPLEVGVAYDHPGLADRVVSESVGLDTAVARYLADGLGSRGRTDVSFVSTSARDRAAAVAGGRLRLAVGTDPLPAQHRAQVREVGPYLVGGLTLAGRSRPTVAALRGRPVCVVQASDAERRLPTLVPGALPRPVRTLSTCLTRVVDGTADAVLEDDVVLRGALATPAYSSLRTLERPLNRTEHMVWVAADDDAACRQVTSSLREMVRSGAWARAVEGDLVTTGALDAVPAAPQVRGC